MRALLTPSDRRKPLARAPPCAAHGALRHRGRRSLGARPAPGAIRLGGAPTAGRSRIVDHIADTLLRRYGVVFWRLLEREAAWLPPWRELLRVLRRLEARGEIRGGRFVAGISGEQFALPEAVDLLRETRRAAPHRRWISLSAADPLNLVGNIVPGPKVPAVTNNRVLYRNGIPVAALVAGEVQWIEQLEAASAWRRRRLIQRRMGSPLLAYLR